MHFDVVCFFSLADYFLSSYLSTKPAGLFIISPIVWNILDLYNNYVLFSYFVTTP